MSEGMQMATVMPKLADCLHRVAVTIHVDLQRLLVEMANQESDLRTKELRKFVHRSRKLLYQTLALCTWLKQDKTRQFFQALAQFHIEINFLQNLFNRNLDELYFIHAGLYYQRSLKHDIHLAFDIATQKTYSTLPSSIFTFGSRTFPIIVPPESVRQKLDISIRTKLALEEKVNMTCGTRMCLKNGVLKVQCGHYCIVFLSLQQLRPSADWKVMGYKIIHDGQYSKHIHYMKDNELAAAEEMQKMRSSSLKSLLHFAVHVATKERLRQTFRHISRMASTPLYRNHLKVNNFDNVDGYDLRVYFWGNEANQHMRFMLRLFTPSIRPDGEHKMEAVLFGYKELGPKELMVDRVDYHYKKIYEFSHEDVHFLLDYATSPEVFMNHIWTSILESKFAILMARMNQSSGSNHTLLSIETNSTKAVITFQNQIKLEVSVDSRSGKYEMDIVDSRHLFGYCEDIVQRFKDEVNSVDCEKLLIEYLLSNAKESIIYPAIVTITLLLTRMDLAVFALTVAPHLPLATDHEMLEISRQYFNTPNIKLDMIAFIIADWDGMQPHKINLSNLYQSLNEELDKKVCKPEVVINSAENQPDKKRVRRIHNEVTLRSRKHWSLFLLVANQSDYSKVLHYGLLKQLPNSERNVELVRSFDATLKLPQHQMSNIQFYLLQAKAWADHTINERMIPRSFTEYTINNNINLASYPSLTKRYAITKCQCFNEDGGGELLYLSFEDDWVDLHFYSCAEKAMKEKCRIIVKDPNVPKSLQEFANEKQMNKPSHFASVRLKMFKLMKKSDEYDGILNVFMLDQLKLFHNSTENSEEWNTLISPILIQAISNILAEVWFPSSKSLSELMDIFELVRGIITMTWLQSVYTSNGADFEDEEDFEVRGLSLRPIVIKRPNAVQVEHVMKSIVFALEKLNENEQHKEILTYIQSMVTLPNYFEDNKGLTISFEPYFDQLSSVKYVIPISHISFGQCFSFLDGVAKFGDKCAAKL